MLFYHIPNDSTEKIILKNRQKITHLCVKKWNSNFYIEKVNTLLTYV